MSVFTPDRKHSRIGVQDEAGFYWLSLEQACVLIGLWFETGAIRQALDLWDAIVAAGGKPQITYRRAA